MSIAPENVARVTPPRGSDHDLAINRDHTTGAGLLTAADLSATETGRRGMWMGHTMIVGEPARHGTVADEAAMLALHDWADDPHTRTLYHYVQVGDSVLREDDPGYYWVCIGGHGTMLSQWERRPLGDTVADAIDLLATKIGSSALEGKADVEHEHPLSDITQSGASEGQVPVWNGSVWIPQTPSAGGGSSIKNNLEVWLGCTDANAAVDLHAGRSCAWVGTPAGAAGKIGRAFSFNGTNQVNVLNYPTLQRKARSGWTCCAWIKASAGDCYWAGANGDPALYARSWYAYINSGGSTCQYAFSNDGWNWPHLVNAPCALNQWVFLAVVCDPLNLSLIGYGHNGLAVRATLNSTPNENALALANNLYCGMAEGSAAMLADGFAYWRRPLRAEELAYIYNDGAGRAYAAL